MQVDKVVKTAIKIIMQRSKRNKNDMMCNLHYLAVKAHLFFRRKKCHLPALNTREGFQVHHFFKCKSKVIGKSFKVASKISFSSNIHNSSQMKYQRLRTPKAKERAGGFWRHLQNHDWDFKVIDSADQFWLLFILTVAPVVPPKHALKVYI